MNRQWKRAVLLFVGMPLVASAQQPDANAQAEIIAKLQAQVESLEGRLAAVESELKMTKLSSGTATIIPAVERVGMVHAALESPQGAPLQTPSPVDIQPTYPSLKIAGFSDVNFSATDQKTVRSGFNEGQFALHLSSALAPKVNVFGEVTASARPDAGTGTPPATGFNFEVERSIIRLDQSDYFKASFGRYHTPINWWNTAFHHGQWLQTTISRPEMTQFGGRFIPVHFVGALVEGAFPSGGLNLNYNLGLGNGRGAVISRGGDAGDNNNNRAWLVNVFAKPDRLFGLQIGASAYRDKVTLGTGREFREWITSGHLVWQEENPEIVAEVANVNHREVGREQTFNSQAFYVQVAYRLPGGERLWKPYYRFEYIHIPRTDALFSGIPNLAGSTVGVRYDISSFAAIKAEYRNQRRLPGQPRVNGGFLQTSFTF